mmetsp:Transcript_3996/g.9566  ORF Transcript_3996/g.9566 Transcript_3996/m.9566 type:complete len:279 (+) Transcript_3996:373-1209(+)
MGSACSGLGGDKPPETVITMDMAMLERLQQEFNDVDVGQLGRIDRQQFEAILLKRAYDARTSESTEFQIGGILDKTNAYKAKDVNADRDLVQMSAVTAFTIADPGNSGGITFAGFCKWQQAVTRRTEKISAEPPSPSSAPQTPLGRSGTQRSLRDRTDAKLRRSSTGERRDSNGTLQSSHAHSTYGSQRSFRAGKHAPMRPRKPIEFQMPKAEAEGRPVKARLLDVPDLAPGEVADVTAPGKDLHAEAEALRGGSDSEEGEMEGEMDKIMAATASAPS